MIYAALVFAGFGFVAFLVGATPGVVLMFALLALISAALSLLTG